MTYGLELMLAVFSIVQGMVSTIITQSGSSSMSSVSLPQELIDAINNVGFWDSIPLWAVTLIGGLLITVLSFTMILTVFGCTPLLRRFRCLHSRVSLQAVWVKLHPQLCGCVFAGRGDCVVLHYFIRHFVQPARCGYKRICCQRRLDLCRRTGVQPAGAGRCHQRL